MKNLVLSISLLFCMAMNAQDLPGPITITEPVYQSVEYQYHREEPVTFSTDYAGEMTSTIIEVMRLDSPTVEFYDVQQTALGASIYNWQTGTITEVTITPETTIDDTFARYYLRE